MNMMKSYWCNIEKEKGEDWENEGDNDSVRYKLNSVMKSQWILSKCNV